MRTILALLALCWAGVAQAAECSYANDGEVIEFRRDLGEIQLTSGAKSETYFDGSGGTGVAYRTAASADGETLFTYWFIDLKDKVKAGMPDHVLIFGNEAFWPDNCN